MQRYPLAPMSGIVLWLTVLLLPLPLVMLWLGRLAGTGPVAWLPAAFVAVVYLFVWLYMRPSRFEVSPTALDVVWPLRRLSIPRSEIEQAELLDAAGFGAKYGRGMRIGAGGLWGGFGLLKTRGVTFRFYISRLDGYVIVHRRNGRPLLITPSDPKQFASALGVPVTRQGHL